MRKCVGCVPLQRFVQRRTAGKGPAFRLYLLCERIDHSRSILKVKDKKEKEEGEWRARRRRRRAFRAARFTFDWTKSAPRAARQRRGARSRPSPSAGDGVDRRRSASFCVFAD